MAKINPIKKAKVKKALMEGKSARQALREANYSNAAISHSTLNAVVKRSMEEILAEYSAKNVTVDSVLKELEELRILAKDKGDYSTAVRVAELKGKWLAMFKEHNINEVEEKSFEFGEFRKRMIEQNRLLGHNSY